MVSATFSYKKLIIDTFWVFLPFLCCIEVLSHNCIMSTQLFIFVQEGNVPFLVSLLFLLSSTLHSAQLQDKVS